MSSALHIVFSADRRVLPGLHVAAYSVLSHRARDGRVVRFHVLSEALTHEDEVLLEGTLRAAGRPYELGVQRLTPGTFNGFPSMQGSWANYLRLLAPEVINANRFVYLDVDILCNLDVAELVALDLADCCAAFVPETTIRAAPDRSVSGRLPAGVDGPYLNSGVMVADKRLWLERKVTQRCLQFLQSGPADCLDQSALNYVLWRGWKPLEHRFNFITNRRSNWPAFKNNALQGKIVHLLDNPKPWDLLCEFLHPQYYLWRSVLDKTAMQGFRSWHDTPSRKVPRTRKAWFGYKKAAKDRVLLAGYSRGWLNRIKGVPRQDGMMLGTTVL